MVVVMILGFDIFFFFCVAESTRHDIFEREAVILKQVNGGHCRHVARLILDGVDWILGHAITMMTLSRCSVLSSARDRGATIGKPLDEKKVDRKKGGRRCCQSVV